MAIDDRAIDTNDTNGTQTAVSAEFTPTEGAVVLVAIHIQDSGTIPAPTLTFSGDGLDTFTQVRLYQEANRTTVLFRALVGAGPTAGQLTIDGGEARDAINYSIVEFTGLKTSGVNAADAIVQSAENVSTSASTTWTVTLNAFASADNRPYGFHIGFSNLDATPEVGYTQLHENLDGWGNRLNSAWKADGADTSVSWTHASAQARAFAVELAAATETISNHTNMLLMGIG